MTQTMQEVCFGLQLQRVREGRVKNGKMVGGGEGEKGKFPDCPERGTLVLS